MADILPPHSAEAEETVVVLDTLAKAVRGDVARMQMSHIPSPSHCSTSSEQAEGDAEQVCEWRVADFDEGENWATGCGNGWCIDPDCEVRKDYVYCPSCGKRVKYVEATHPQPLPEGGE